MSTTDKIEKKVVLRAPHERVWKAISDSKQFGTWFGVDFDGPFVEWEEDRGRQTPGHDGAGQPLSRDRASSGPLLQRSASTRSGASGVRRHVQAQAGRDLFDPAERTAPGVSVEKRSS